MAVRRHLADAVDGEDAPGAALVLHDYCGAEEFFELGGQYARGDIRHAPGTEAHDHCDAALGILLGLRASPGDCRHHGQRHAEHFPSADHKSYS